MRFCIVIISQRLDKDINKDIRSKQLIFEESLSSSINCNASVHYTESVYTESVRYTEI